MCAPKASTTTYSLPDLVAAGTSIGKGTYGEVFSIVNPHAKGELCAVKRTTPHKTSTKGKDTENPQYRSNELRVPLFIPSTSHLIVIH